MRWRSFNWLVFCLVVSAVSLWCWHARNERAARTQAAVHSSDSPLHPFTLPPASQILNLPGARPVAAASVMAELTNSSALTYRLTNTDQTVGQLARNDRAILLENALMETSGKVELPIPDHLRAHGEPGAYIVQARGTVDNAFRAALRDAGARIISYIPNNAFLVQMASTAVEQLQGQAQVVVPYEPYYKLKPGLLGLAVKELPLPEGINLRLLLFADGKEATEQALQKLGVTVVGEERSPFGPIIQVAPPVESGSATNRRWKAPVYRSAPRETGRCRPQRKLCFDAGRGFVTMRQKAPAGANGIHGCSETAF